MVGTELKFSPAGSGTEMQSFTAASESPEAGASHESEQSVLAARGATSPETRVPALPWALSESSARSATSPETGSSDVQSTDSRAG